MRLRALLLALLFLLLSSSPLARSMHAVEVETSLSPGESMYLHLVGSGTAKGTGYVTGPSLTQTANLDWRYDVDISVTLPVVEADGVIRGFASLGGGGTGTATVVWEHGNGLTETMTCAFARDLSDPPPGVVGTTMAVIDKERGTLIVHVLNIGLPPPGDDCSHDGQPQQPQPYPSPAPLLATTDANAARYERLFEAAGGFAPDWTSGLTVELPLASDVHTFSETLDTDGYESDVGLAYCHSGVSVDTCVGASQLTAKLVLDVCPRALKSGQEHAQMLRALRSPGEPISESQARAFAADARTKITSYVADERAMQVYGCPGTLGADAEVTRVLQLVTDAWVAVARGGTMSDDAKREFIAHERQRELLGQGPMAPEASAIFDALASSVSASGTARVHSPVALHVWTQDGRHLGYNETTQAIDQGIPGATYEGEPGRGQVLTLPEGLYKLSVTELGYGAFTLDLEEGNATALIPLDSLPGRTTMVNVLVDATGMHLGGARRALTGAEAPFILWQAPSATAPTGEGGDGAPSGSSDVPGPGLAAVAIAAALCARSARRRA